MTTPTLTANKVGSSLGKSPQSGFSLIELMVAMVISLLIMGAILTLFLDVSRTNDEMAKTNIQIENGRFAIQILQEDLAHAGFWNGYVPQFDDLTEEDIPGDYPAAVPAPCQAYAPWSASYLRDLLGIPVQGYDDVPPGCASVVTNKAANTDVLLVRHAGTCVPGVGNCEADTAGKLYFQASLCEDDSAGYVLDTAGFTLHQKTIQTGLTSCSDAASTALAEKRKYISSIYYIRDFSVTAGDGIPTLMRSRFDVASGVLEHQPAEALVEGVEGFRLEFGIDNLSKTGAAVNYAQAVNWLDANNKTTPTNRGDGSPDGDFVRCPAADVAADTTPPSTHPAATVCTVDQLANAVAVKLYVLVRSLVATPGYSDGKTYSLGSTTLGPFNDGFKRHVFSTTVRLNNISRRRETP